MSLTFITDLGDTILYRKESPTDICLNDSKVDSSVYLTEKSFEFIKEIQLNKDINFIVCTARTYREVQDLTVIKNADIIISSFGASIHYQKVRDTEWDEYIKFMSDFDELKIIHEKLRAVLLYLAEVEFKEYFIKIKSNLLDKGVLAIIKGVLEENKTEYKLFRSKNKIYVVPKWLDKQIAVKYIIQKYKLQNMIVSGNNLIDKEFLSLEDLTVILPKHADKTLHSTANIITQAEGIEAGEEILEYVTKSKENRNSLIIEKLCS
jgi:hydroxymethylpyrimidine pyrophosphatase-like HAD family hydrolase